MFSQARRCTTRRGQCAYQAWSKCVVLVVACQSILPRGLAASRPSRASSLHIGQKPHMPSMSTKLDSLSSVPGEPNHANVFCSPLCRCALDCALGLCDSGQRRHRRVLRQHRTECELRVRSARRRWVHGIVRAGEFHGAMLRRALCWMFGHVHRYGHCPMHIELPGDVRSGMHGGSGKVRLCRLLPRRLRRKLRCDMCRRRRYCRMSSIVQVDLCRPV